MYFAYGSNINLDQMAYRCPAAQVVGPVVLEGYELLFRGNASGNGVATIKPKEFAATQAEMALPPSSPRKGSRYMACFGGSHRAVSGLLISMRDIPTYTKKSLLLCGIMRGGS